VNTCTDDLVNKVNYIWNHPNFSFGNVSYIVIRYVGDAMAILNLINFLGNGVQTVIFCKVYFLFLTWFGTGLTVFFVQLVLQARLYALYDRSRFILAIMVFLCVCEFAAMVTIIGFLDAYWQITNEILTSYICADIDGPSFFQMYMYWLPVIVCHTVLCLLALWRGVRNCMRESRIHGMNRARLADILVKGNTTHYLCVILTSLTNIIIGQYLGPTWVTVSEAFPAPIHVVIGCRLILNLRSALSCDVEGDSDYSSRDVETVVRFALPDASVPG